jgi:hypothetical protein
MKNLFKMTLMVAFLSFLFVSCKDTPTENEIDLEEAREDVVEAEHDLQQSKLDSVSDYKQFKYNIELKIIENQKQIDEMQAQLKTSRNANKESSEKKWATLEAKNATLKAKIQEYEQGTSEKWEIFKMNFNNEMDEVGKSISEMANENKKN